MDINSRNLGQQEEDLDKKKFRKRASMSRSNKRRHELRSIFVTNRRKKHKGRELFIYISKV